MTDFSPVEGEVIALSVLVGEAVRGSGFGPTDELRVNMEPPGIGKASGTGSADQAPRPTCLATRLV